VQTHKHAPLTLVLLDWGQAGRLSPPLRHALIAPCLYCVSPATSHRQTSWAGYSRVIWSPSVFRRLRALAIRKEFVQMHNTCWRVSDIRAMFHLEAQESPRALTTKTKERS